MIKNDIEISVVIPTLGNIIYLERSIKSILNQTYPVKEIIVVADKYTENTKEYLENLKNKNKVIIKVFYNEISCGGSEARNIGIRNSSSEWIALLDDDDEWLPKKIEKQVNSIRDSADSDAVFCSLFYLDNGKQLKKYPNHNYLNKYDLGYYLFGIRFGKGFGAIQTSSILAKRNTFLEVEFSKGLIKHQDWDWLLRVHNFGKRNIVQIPEVTTIYHVPKNNRSNVSRVNRWRFSEQWIRGYKDIISKKAYSNFLQSMVIQGIIDDNSMQLKDQLKEIKRINKEITFESKISIYNLRLFIRIMKRVIFRR